MRTVVSTIIGLVVLCGAPAVVAEDVPEPADEGTQRLSLPGFDVSIAVPAAWQVEPLIGTPYPAPPHPTSPFVLRLWTGAAGRDDRAGCFLYAYSRLGCGEPVVLEAETSGIGPPWETFSAAPSAYIADESMGEWACVRHLSSDGADLFEVKCCGETVPADGWRSIAETLELPDRTRPERVAAADRNLAKDVIATNSIWWDANGGTLVFEGDGFREPAQKRAWDPRVEAVVEALARPAATISIDEQVYRGADGEDVLVVDTIRARKADLATRADPDAVRDAILAFATTEWQETREGDPTLETLPIGRYEATRATFDDGAAPEYIVSRGNTALKLRAATDDIAQSWLSALPCYHLDVYPLITDVLIENRPDR